MMSLFQKIDQLHAHRELLAGGRFGVIEARGGQWQSVTLRPWPKLISWPELWPVRTRFHGRGAADRCWLYYNQPLRTPNYLALRYIVSTEATSYATFRAAIKALDCIAAVKQTDAIVCDAGNTRLSDRLMRRWGWEPHKPQRWHRNFIRRFYGDYPSYALSW